MSADHTFVFADLAGYTALTEAHGDEAAADVVEAFCRFACRRLARFEAERIKGIGDALMLRTDRAELALGLAVELVWEIGGTHGFPHVGVGVHTGPAIRRGSDWFGSVVNLAARVADAADPGHVLCTDMTRAAAGPCGELLLSFLGRRAFKNLERPVGVWDVTPLAQPRSSRLGIDPVCRMAIDPQLAAHRLLVDGSEVLFCSRSCADSYAERQLLLEHLDPEGPLA